MANILLHSACSIYWHFAKIMKTQYQKSDRETIKKMLIISSLLQCEDLGESWELKWYHVLISQCLKIYCFNLYILVLLFI